MAHWRTLLGVAGLLLGAAGVAGLFKEDAICVYFEIPFDMQFTYRVPTKIKTRVTNKQEDDIACGIDNLSALY